MFVILLTADIKFRNRSTCSKGPMKRTGKVCGDSQDLKSPGGKFSAESSGDAHFYGPIFVHEIREKQPPEFASLANI